MEISRAEGLPIAYAAALTVGGIALNVILGTIARISGVPGLYLDLGGTMLTAIILGPWWGAATGLLTNVFLALTINPISLPFGFVNLLVGITVGYFAKYGFLKDIKRFIIVFIVTMIITSFSASIIVTFLFGGATGAPQDIVVFALLSSGGWSMFSAVFTADIMTKPLDHIPTWIIVFAILRALPAELRERTMFAVKPS